MTELKPFCPLCDKFLYDPETEYPKVCEKHYLDEEIKSFFEKVTAAIGTIITEVDALKAEIEGEELL